MSRFMNARYEALEAYAPGEQPRDKRYIKLNTNESPYPPAPEVVAAMNARQVEDLRLYSDPTGKALREKIAALNGLSWENVILTNGSDDVLNFAFMAFSGDGVAFPDITYGFYSVFAQLHGIETKVIPLREDFTLNYRDYCGLNKMIVIANPNAPTGLAIPLAEIREILRTNPNHVVVIDEAYVDFGGESAAMLIGEFENLLVTQTFSKSRSMAGARLGFGMGSKAIMEDLEKLRYSTNPYNINRLTMFLGEKTLEHNDYYLENCRRIADTREYTKAELQKLGFTVLPGLGNFLFAASPAISGEKLYLELKDRGILVRHFSNPRICNYNRISIGTREEMQTFIRTVKEIKEGML
ncbi:MAG: histidinol-phosphate transaminase [Faecousia sp.]